MKPLSEISGRTGAALALALGLTACGSGPEAEPAAAAAVREEVAADPDAGLLGDGFVVWESNRSGAWRIWMRDLAPGAAPRRLSRDEENRSHCCAHISPDGRRVAYLSLPRGGEAYLEGKTTGPLHVVSPATGEDRVAVAEARTYFENRAAVWRSPEELVFIAGDGRTSLLEVASGATTILTEKAAASHGWLINADLSWATFGRPAFSPYDRTKRAIAERAELGGCQPYFSADGRWGYWVAGAGGPVNRVDLATGEVSTILRKNDERLADGFGYVYFPMFSHDGRALAFAASRGEHDHLKANYEVFVAAAEPRDLSLVGGLRRITDHPSPDRFPDVYLAPLPLGLHAGEAPYSLELELPGGGEWSLDFGDGETGRGAVASHRYPRPGRYRLEARRGGRTLAGRVEVLPASPPRPVKVELVEAGREVRVLFDEEIAALEPSLSFASGIEVEAWTIADAGRTLVVRPREPLTRFDRLELAGIADRAQRTNVLEQATLEIEPPLWPLRREDLLFLWETGDAPNLVFDPELGGERATLLEAKGRAYLDGLFRMVLRGGTFAATAEESNRLRWALQATNELSLEMTVEAPEDRTIAESALVVFGQRGQPHNFALLQRGRRLVFSLRIAGRGPDVYREAELADLEPGRRHLVLSYAPGQLTLDVDGRRVVESAAIQGGFFHWRSVALGFGGRPGGGLEWSGKMEGVALYDRVLTAAEAREAFLRHRRLTAGRAEPRELLVEASLVRRSPAPSPADIRPYREALAVHEYEVERVLSGEAPAGRLRVAEWALLDGSPQPPAAARPGDRATLRLEPFAEQPQLASVYLSNSLGGAPQFFAVP